MISQELRQLRADMNRARVSRREGAEALHLSYSAFNRKLRGERPLLPQEARQLREYIAGKAKAG
ncbi:MAG: hypothetical protein PHP02_01410 [Eubacteriales bacterium]|nr:hypothetical protein [Eubacteriales bacterium]